MTNIHYKDMPCGAKKHLPYAENLIEVTCKKCVRKINYKNGVGKHDIKTKKAINDFWIENKYPPTLRDIMKLTNITSTSVCRYVVHKMKGIRISKNGRIIPLWVDDMFDFYLSED